MKKKNLNKAVTDSISAALENGINVNIRIDLYCPRLRYGIFNAVKIGYRDL